MKVENGRQLKDITKRESGGQVVTREEGSVMKRNPKGNDTEPHQDALLMEGKVFGYVSGRIVKLPNAKLPDKLKT